MNPDSKQFEQLKKLLVLKRHEQPPPGYFAAFSGQVIARIKNGDSAEDGGAWARKLWAFFETKPMLTGAVGAAACALVISGIIFSEDGESAGTSIRSSTPELNPALGSSMAFNSAPETSRYSSSTNPVSPALRDLLEQPQFDKFNVASPANAGFGFPGN